MVSRRKLNQQTEINSQAAQSALANFKPAAPATPSYPNLGTKVMSQPQISAQERAQMKDGMNTKNDVFTGSFNSAFGQARKAGLKEFTWNGKRYGTQLASAKQAAPQNEPSADSLGWGSNQGPYRSAGTMAPTRGFDNRGAYSTTGGSFTRTIGNNPNYETYSILTRYASPPPFEPVPIQQAQMPVHNRQAAQPQVKASPVPTRNNVRGGSNSVQATTARYAANNTVGGDFGIGRGLRRIGEGVVNFFRSIPRDNTGARPLGLAPGHTTRYATGGKLGDKQQEFVAYLIQASGVETEDELNDYIQDLGQEGLQRELEKFEELMTQGTEQVPAAAKGAKLNYIKSLRGQCPEGFEMQYFKKGGVMCSQCIKKAKAQKAPTKAEQGTKVVQDFKADMKKCGGKMKGKMKKKEDGGKVKTIPGVLDTKENKLSPKSKVQIKKHYFGGKL